MRYFLPTYEQAKQICDANDNFIFFETLHEVNGYKISIFSYRLSPKNFKKPLGDIETEITAYENRGLTFVFNSDGSLYKRYLLMNKFFNVNQVEDTMFHNIKDLPIKNIMNKEDGSVISFIRLPDDTIHGKSKASFISYQAIQATEILNKDKELYAFVSWCIDNDIIAVYEYVSPQNEIVLRYTKEKLVLLKLRCNKTGKYLDINEVLARYKSLSGVYNGEVAKVFSNITLEELMNKAEYDEYTEGWVVEFEDNDLLDLVKVKTKWYFYQHSISFSVVNRENIIIRMILDDTVDDALAMDLNDELRKYMNDIIDVVNSYINYNIDFIVSTVKNAIDNKLTQRDVHAQNCKYIYIKPLMRHFIDPDDTDKLLTNFKFLFRSNVHSLGEALKFLESQGLKVKRFVN